MDGTVNKAVVRGYLALLCSGDWSGWDRYFARDVMFNGETDFRGWATRNLRSIRDTAAAFEILVEDQLAEGDKVATRVHFSLRAPDGREVTYPGIAIDRIVEGKVVEMWHMANHGRALRELRRDDRGYDQGDDARRQPPM